MDIRLNLQNLDTPQDILRLTSILAEMADNLDTLYLTIPPNGAISARQGRIAIYKNGSNYETWLNTTGSTVWIRIDKDAVTPGIPLTYLDTDGTLAANSDVKVPSQKAVKTYADTKISKTTAGEIAAMTEKTTLADADVFLIEDSAQSNAKKKAQFSNILPSTVMKKVTYTTGSGNWTAPAGITTVYVTMIGGGGGGGGANDQANTGAGGGGSGSWINKRAITVTPTSSYAYSVGAAGAGGANEANGTAGEDSTFGSTLATAKGGNGGISRTNGGAGGAAVGAASGATGGIGYPGLAGQPGTDLNYGGGGAGSPFGQGGDGATEGNGSAAVGYGAGGGGARRSSGAGKTGGAGTGGIIILEY